nr:hypothetical protein [uncultured Methanobrevibacter sp.]
MCISYIFNDGPMLASIDIQMDYEVFLKVCNIQFNTKCTKVIVVCSIY